MRLIVSLLLTLAVGLVMAAASAFFPEHHESSIEAASSIDKRQAPQTPDKAAVWLCPMHPHIMQDHPGDCPICGMHLVETAPAKVEANANAIQRSAIQIDSATVQRMGVRLTAAVQRPLAREVRTYGIAAIDEDHVFNINPKTEGWIRRLHVSAVGEHVRQGQVLYELYSPELLARQREYITLLQRRDQLLGAMSEMSGQNAQVAASLARERLRTREKFLFADIDEQSLRAIEQSHRPIEVVSVRAQRSGWVIAIDAREGSYVTPMSTVLTLADPARLKLDVALFANELQWVRTGDAATLRLHDGGPRHARLDAVSPVIDAATRTAKALIRIDNRDGGLHAGSYVDVRIAAAPRTALAVPAASLIRTGEGAMVMQALGEGRFLPTPVHTGVENGEWIEITDGLESGAQVAVNGQFLLDAAASLQASAQRLRTAD